MKEYYGNYVGLVVQNNDPDRMGKVKVFVPHISGTVYKRWVEEKLNKKFNFPGANLYSALTESIQGINGDENVTTIIQELKNILPWAQCAAPLTSENSSGRFNSFHSFGGISDANYYSEFSSTTTDASATPGKPGAFYEKTDNRLSDAFTKASNNVNRPNPLSYEYVPSTYSNRAKGAFGIPAVGSHVWVFFRDGNPTQPVYFAVAYGEVDWRGIYESYETPGVDYPGSFENSIEYNDNVETYRNKYVINQKGGSIEITNTDLKENIKFTHYSGSFKEFNNQANIELATNNDQKLVLNDEYSTVRGFKNEYTGKNLDEIIVRDKYKKVGSLNADAFREWKSVVAPIQDNKQLFEIQRAVPNNVYDPSGRLVIKRNSLMQTRVGTFAPHPVLQGTNLYWCLENNSITVPSTINSVSNSVIDGPSRLFDSSIPATTQPIFTPSSFDAIRYQGESGVVWGTGGVGASTSSENGVWAPDLRKENIATLMQAAMTQLADIESKLGIGGSEIIQITKHKIETIGMEVNDFGSFRYDEVGKMLSNEMLIDKKGTYVNYKESPLLEYTHVQDLPGGNYTLNVCNRFNVLVGAGGLNLKSIGPTNITGTITNIAGEQLNLVSENEVNIDSNTINISANILRLKNKNNRQVFVDSNLGVSKNIIVGGALSVEGEMFVQHITAPKEYQVTEPTTVFGSIVGGTTLPITIRLQGVALGGLGNSVTNSGGPSNLMSYTPGGLNFIDILGTITIGDEVTPDCIKLAPHSHVFPNLPLTLFNSNEEVRISGSELNSNNIVPATQRIHEKK
jgi:hypothetical protein